MSKRGRKREYYTYEYPWTKQDMELLEKPTKVEDPIKWDTGTKATDKQATSCSFSCETEKATIKIAWDVYTVMKQLCVHIKDEWQILLIGEVDGPVVDVTDYIIPKQEVTGSSVKNLDCIDKQFIEENKVVAICHSHSNMGVFFSSTDVDTNLQSIKYHIVYNNEGNVKACHQIVLPCGMVQLRDADVELMLKDSGIKNLENITKITYGHPVTEYNRNNWREARYGGGLYGDGVGF